MEKKKSNKDGAPKASWEIKYEPCVYKDSRTTRGSEFNPKRSSDRMTTYNKVNKEDH